MKKITLGISGCCLVTIPFLVSPLVLNNDIKDNDIFNLANFEKPQTEFGWNSILSDSEKQYKVYESKIQNYINKNVSSQDEDIDAEVFENKLSVEIKNSDDFQYYLVHNLRIIISKLYLLEYNKNNPLYQLNVSEKENIASLKTINKTSEEYSFIFHDKDKKYEFKFNSVQLSNDGRSLIYEIYDKTVSIYGKEIEQMAISASESYYDEVLVNYVEEFNKMTSNLATLKDQLQLYKDNQEDLIGFEELQKEYDDQIAEIKNFYLSAKELLENDIQSNKAFEFDILNNFEKYTYEIEKNPFKVNYIAQFIKSYSNDISFQMKLLFKVRIFVISNILNEINNENKVKIEQSDYAFIENAINGKYYINFKKNDKKNNNLLIEFDFVNIKAKLFESKILKQSKNYIEIISV